MARERAPNIAIFVDFENVAIGVREARYDAFDVGLVIQRILDKGKIVVRKAYSDWERYKAAKRPLHEAAFELIEIPHVSLSGKNSADIRLVVDALDLCYTKEHVDMVLHRLGRQRLFAAGIQAPRKREDRHRPRGQELQQ